MIELDFKIAGKQAGTPKNVGEIKLVSDWSNNSTENISEAEVSTNVLQFVLDDAKTILNHINGGALGTSTGIFEGLSLNINLRDLNNNVVKGLLDGYIDLAEEHTIISCDEIEARIKKLKNLDWLTNRADSFSFAYLAALPIGSVGKISTGDYVRVPYVLNYRPEAFALTMISMSIFMTTQALSEAIKAVSDAIGDITEPLSVGFSVDVGDAIAASLRLVANTAYSIALSIALVKMIEELIDQIFPPVRRYYGMPILTMFEKGFEFLGLQFSSTIFNIPKWKNLVYLPQKSERGGVLGKVNGVGYPNQNSAIYNFGDFLRVMKDAFNAQIKIVGNVVHFERTDYWNKRAVWKLPDVETDQSLRLSTFKYNTDELLSNFMISFQTDFQDENTLENFKGTNYQIITQPNIVTLQEYVNIKGLGQVRLPFARATRKDNLTEVENLLNLLAALVDNTINFLGGNSNMTAKISNRKGMMHLSADTTGADKLLVMNGEKIPSNVSDQLNASDFWDFHAVNSFVEINDPITGDLVHNQYKIYDGVEIPFCYEDWLTLTSNNRFLTANNEQGEILSLEWDIQNDKANITYKISHLYTKNLNLVFNEGE